MIKLSLNDEVKQSFSKIELTITFRACTKNFFLITHFNKFIALVVSTCFGCLILNDYL